MEENYEVIEETVPVADAAAVPDSEETVQPPAESSGEAAGSDASDVKQPEETGTVPDMSGTADGEDSATDETADGMDDVTLDAETSESITGSEEGIQETTDTDTQEGETKTETVTGEEDIEETETEAETEAGETQPDISQLYQMLASDTEAEVVMEVPFLEKPITEYTTEEGLLLLLLILGLLSLAHKILFE